MSKTLLPLNEPLELQQKDIAYRNAIQERTQNIDLNPMTCEISLLPSLAQCWQVLYWDENWSELEKRRFVRDAREVHNHIGTPYALAKMFEALDISATVVEWYEYGGEPYHFNIDLSLETKEITPEVLIELRKYVQVYKNVRTVLEELQLSYKLDGFVSVATAMDIEAVEHLTVLEEYTHTLDGFVSVATAMAIEAVVNLDFLEV